MPSEAMVAKFPQLAKQAARLKFDLGVIIPFRQRKPKGTKRVAYPAFQSPYGMAVAPSTTSRRISSKTRSESLTLLKPTNIFNDALRLVCCMHRIMYSLPR
jgi:hypothetical protein